MKVATTEEFLCLQINIAGFKQLRILNKFAEGRELLLKKVETIIKLTSGVMYMIILNISVSCFLNLTTKALQAHADQLLAAQQATPAATTHFLRKI